MIRPLTRALAFSLVALLVATNLRAADPAPAAISPALAIVSRDALGFALVRNLSQVDAAADKLLKLFHAPLPAPLALATMATGLGPGVDLAGDLALVMLPAEPGKSGMIPVVAAPVADYAAFIQPLKGDVAGEICRVSIGGEDLLAAEQGSFALLMNVENRATLERILAVPPAPPQELAEFAAWMADNDATVALLPAGVERLWETGTLTGGPNAGQSQATPSQEEDVNPFDSDDGQPAADVASLKKMLGGQRCDFRAVAVGLAVGDDLGVRLRKRVLARADGQFMAFTTGDKPLANPWRGLADEEFVSIAGGPMPKSTRDLVVKLLERFTHANRKELGYDGIPPDELQAALAAQRPMYDGIESITYGFFAGKPDDPLVANVIAVIGCDNAAAWLDRWEAGMKASNDLTTRGTGELKIIWQLSRSTIANRPVVNMEADGLKVLHDDNVPFMDAFVKDLVGKDGVLRWNFEAVDDKTVVMTFGAQTAATEIVALTRANKAPLAANAEVTAADKLCPAAAPWRGFASPQGFLTWLERLLAFQGRYIGVGAPKLAEFPASPPLGWTVAAQNGVIDAEVVVPPATVRAIADFTAAQSQQAAAP